MSSVATSAERSGRPRRKTLGAATRCRFAFIARPRHSARPAGGTARGSRRLRRPPDGRASGRVPGVKIEMGPSEAGLYESLQEQRGMDRAGEGIAGNVVDVRDLAVEVLAV